MARVNAAATNLASEIAICDMPSTTLIVANVDQCSFEFLNLSNPTPQQQISTVSLQLACDYPTAVAS